MDEFIKMLSRKWIRTMQAVLHDDIHHLMNCEIGRRTFTNKRLCYILIMRYGYSLFIDELEHSLVCGCVYCIGVRIISLIMDRYLRVGLLLFSIIRLLRLKLYGRIWALSSADSLRFDMTGYSEPFHFVRSAHAMA
jgi:hypothetical protein